MKLHVTSDGTASGTVIKDIDTGEIVNNIAEIRFAITKNRSQAIAEVTLFVPVAHVELKAAFEEVEFGKSLLRRSEEV